MTLKRRTDMLALAIRPLSARQMRHALRMSRRAKVVRWIGASKTRRMAAAPGGVDTSAAPPAEVIVLSWKQLFGRNLGVGPAASPVLDRAPDRHASSNLLVFRAN